MSHFEQACKNVLGIEKGYVDNPADNGGKTKYGITEKTAREDGYVGRMQDLPVERAMSIFKRKFWDKISGDNLPYPLSEYLFDFAVNSGPETAIKALQAAVGALPDGVAGPRTLAATNRHTQLDVIRLVFVFRCKLMAEHEDYEEFKNGWFARMFDVTVRAIHEGL